MQRLVGLAVILGALVLVPAAALLLLFFLYHGGIVSVFAISFVGAWLGLRNSKAEILRELGTTSLFLFIGLFPHLLFLLCFDGDDAFMVQPVLLRYEEFAVFLSDLISPFERTSILFLAAVIIALVAGARCDLFPDSMTKFMLAKNWVHRIALMAGAAASFTLFTSMDAGQWSPDTHRRLAAVLAREATQREVLSLIASLPDDDRQALAEVAKQISEAVQAEPLLGMNGQTDAVESEVAEEFGRQIGGMIASSAEVTSESSGRQTQTSQQDLLTLRDEVPRATAYRASLEPTIKALASSVVSGVPLDFSKYASERILSLILEEAVQSAAEEFTFRTLHEMDPGTFQSLRMRANFVRFKWPDVVRSFASRTSLGNEWTRRIRDIVVRKVRDAVQERVTRMKGGTEVIP